MALKQVTVCLAVDSCPCGHVMFQDWAYTVPEGQLVFSLVKLTGNSLFFGEEELFSLGELRHVFTS